jgi:AraC family transcriptional regulator
LKTLYNSKAKYYLTGIFEDWSYKTSIKQGIDMQPKIVTLPTKKLVGIRMRMSFSDNKTGQLWRSFMPRRKEIKNTVGSVLYSVEVYGPQFFDKFDPNTEFDKWAAVEVTDFDTSPDEMDTIISPSGLYAIFYIKDLQVRGKKHTNIFSEHGCQTLISY